MACLLWLRFFHLMQHFSDNGIRYYLFHSMHGVFFTSYSTTLPSDYMNCSINSAGVIISGLSTSISEKSFSPVTRISTSSMIAVYSSFLSPVTGYHLIPISIWICPYKMCFRSHNPIQLRHSLHQKLLFCMFSGHSGRT